MKITREGKKVVQLFISDLIASLIPDAKRLRGFEKVDLKSGESKQQDLSCLQMTWQLLIQRIKERWKQVISRCRLRIKQHHSA